MTQVEPKESTPRFQTGAMRHSQLRARIVERGRGENHGLARGIGAEPSLTDTALTIRSPHAVQGD